MAKSFLRPREMRGRFSKKKRISGSVQIDQQISIGEPGS
jgi:hypothetical protein